MIPTARIFPIPHFFAKGSLVDPRVRASNDTNAPSKLACDLPLRATFSPAHPLARRDVPLARARGVRDRALREQLGRTENMSA